MASDSPAGQSARVQAEQATAAAHALERKAAYARRRAEHFNQGADGEATTAHALTGLTSDGWHVLHDRLAPNGGNVDHIAVGPAGAVILDAKSWSGSVTLTPTGTLSTGRYDKTREVEALAAHASHAQAALRADGHNSTPVLAALVCTRAGADLPATTVTAAGPPTIVVGVEQLPNTLAYRSRALTPAQVADVLAVLESAFPPAHRSKEEIADEAISKGAGVSNLFAKSNTFCYLETWSKAGRRRLYLNDEAGTTLGYKDLNTEAVKVAGDADPDLVRSILRAAQPGGFTMRRQDVPRISTRLTGGRLLAAFGGVWTNFLIGQHWRKGSQDRLYVHHALVRHGSFYVGHVDMTSGALHPTSTSPLAKDLGTPSRYLELALAHYPRLRA